MTLKSYSNPDVRKDWSISIEVSEGISLLLRIIPDKLMIDHQSAKEYLLAQAKKSWPSPESMILNIIEDINNELIPKWLEVTYTFGGITIQIEDKQPG